MRWTYKGFADHRYETWIADGFYYLHYEMRKGDEKVRTFTCRMPVDKYYGKHTCYDWEDVDRWDADLDVDLKRSA